MRQVSPLPAGGAGIQVPYGKSGTPRHSPPKDETSRDADSDDPAEHAAATQSAPPPGMGKRIDKTI